MEVKNKKCTKHFWKKCKKLVTKTGRDTFMCGLCGVIHSCDMSCIEISHGYEEVCRVTSISVGFLPFESRTYLPVHSRKRKRTEHMQCQHLTPQLLNALIESALIQGGCSMSRDTLSVLQKMCGEYFAKISDFATFVNEHKIDRMTFVCVLLYHLKLGAVFKKQTIFPRIQALGTFQFHQTTKPIKKGIISGTHACQVHGLTKRQQILKKIIEKDNIPFVQPTQVIQDTLPKPAAFKHAVHKFKSKFIICDCPLIMPSPPATAPGPAL